MIRLPSRSHDIQGIRSLLWLAPLSLQLAIRNTETKRYTVRTRGAFQMSPTEANEEQIFRNENDARRHGDMLGLLGPLDPWGTR